MVWRRSTVRFRNGAPAHEAFRTSGLLIKCQTKCQFLRRSGYTRCAVSVFWVVAEDGVHHAFPAADGGHDHVPIDRLGDVGGLVPTVSLISCSGTPLLLMIDTAVCRPSWACQPVVLPEPLAGVVLRLTAVRHGHASTRRPGNLPAAAARRASWPADQPLPRQRTPPPDRHPTPDQPTPPPCSSSPPNSPPPSSPACSAYTSTSPSPGNAPREPLN